MQNIITGSQIGQKYVSKTSASLYVQKIIEINNNAQLVSSQPLFTVSKFNLQ